MVKVAIRRFLPKEFYAVEAIKTLRTNLLFSGDEYRVIALTSQSASAGKSSISFQLAASLALTGKRVLLLDTDLRKSVLAHRFAVKEKVDGLSHLLSGMAKPHDVLCETDLPGLYMIFAGARVPNPAEILGGHRFTSLISVLRTMFDYVIVDTAPLGQVIDCAIIAPNVDGTLIVVDVMKNSYKLERRIKRQLEKAGAKVLGVVLNRVNYKDKTGYYGKAYRYGYGYGYGYGEK